MKPLRWHPCTEHQDNLASVLYRMKRSLSITLLCCVFVFTSMAQRNVHLKKHRESDIPKDRNILTINLMLGGLGIGFAVGGEYERIFGGGGKFSFHLPFAYSSTHDRFLEVVDDGDRFHDYKTFSVSPGVRFHPA